MCFIDLKRYIKNNTFPEDQNFVYIRECKSAKAAKAGDPDHCPPAQTVHVGLELIL